MAKGVKVDDCRTEVSVREIRHFSSKVDQWYEVETAEGQGIARANKVLA